MTVSPACAVLKGDCVWREGDLPDGVGAAESSADCRGPAAAHGDPLDRRCIGQLFVTRAAGQGAECTAVARVHGSAESSTMAVTFHPVSILSAARWHPPLSRPVRPPVLFGGTDVYDIDPVGKQRPVERSANVVAPEDMLRHGTRLDIPQAEHRALLSAARLAAELDTSLPLAFVVVAKSRRWRKPEVCYLAPPTWLADTGSGHDLVDSSVVECDAGLINPRGSEIGLCTANGSCYPRGTLRMAVPELGEFIEALVLDSTPSVLSVGLRCMEYGYGFHWEPFSRP